MNMSIESRSPMAASEPSTASGSGAAAGDPLDREDGVGSLSRRDIPDDNYLEIEKAIPSMTCTRVTVVTMVIVTTQGGVCLISSPHSDPRR